MTELRSNFDGKTFIFQPEDSVVRHDSPQRQSYVPGLDFAAGWYFMFAADCLIWGLLL